MGLNDPQWGSKNSGGPPDLEALLRKLNQKMAALLEQGLAADWGSSEVPAAQAHALLGNAIASASICVMRQGCVPPLRAEVKDRLALATVEFA